MASGSVSAPVDVPCDCLANGLNVTILDVGVEFTYTVLSFSVLQVNLRQATVQIELDDGSGVLYDSFIQAHPSLPARRSSVPFYITIEKHCFALRTTL